MVILQLVGGASYLGLIANYDVILHGVRNVVNTEDQEGAFWNVDQTQTGPRGTAVQGVWPGHNCHALKRRCKHMTSQWV